MDGLGLRRACLGHHASFRIRWATDSPGPSGGVRDCTTPHQKTHGTEAGDEVEVVYPWHPWAGRTVRVHEVVERGAIASARCSLAGATPVHFRDLPLWMLDAAGCRTMRIEAHPMATLCALAALHRLLSAERKRSGAELEAAAIASPESRGDRDGTSSSSEPTPSTRTRAGKYAHKPVQPASLDSAAGANATNADRAVDAPARVPRGRAHCGAGWERRNELARVGHEQARQQLCQRSLRWLRQRCPRRRAGRAYVNICQPEFELTGWVPTTTTFHGDLRETREMLSPLLPTPPQSASSRPRADGATPRARRASPSGAPLCASCGSPLHQASKAAAPECVQASPLQGCIAPRQLPHARLPHERERCARPKDAKGRRPRPRRQLPYRVSSGEELYSTIRRHSTVGYVSPVESKGRSD